MFEVPVGDTKVLLNNSHIQAVQDKGDKVAVYLSFGIMEVDLDYENFQKALKEAP